MGLGEILDGAVQTIRQNPWVMLGLSAIVNLVLGVIVGLIQLSALRDSFTSFGDPTYEPDSAAPIGQLVSSVAALVVQAVGTTVLTGLLVIAVSDAVLGRRPGIRPVWDRARGRLWALLGVTVVIFVGLVAIAVVAVAPGVVALIAGTDVLGVLLLIAGILAAIVLGAWIGLRWLFAPQIVLLERLGVRAALGRSWRLVRGSWWRCFGIVLLAQLIAGLVSGVLQVPFLIGGFVAADAGGPTVGVVLSVLGGVVARTLIAPFTAAILVLLYIDLRMRREGLDVTLQRAANER